MKKLLLLFLLLGLFGGCAKKQKSLTKGKQRKTIKSIKTQTAPVKIEDIDDFILETDSDENIFDEIKPGQIREEDFSWKELADNSQELKTVQFEFDKSEIKTSEQNKIKTNAKKIKTELKKHPNAKVSVRGHSCKIAKSPEYNYVLSQQRAQKVSSEYAKKGIAKDKLKPVGFGDSLVIVENGNIEAQAPNRRAETVILDIEE